MSNLFFFFFSSKTFLPLLLLCCNLITTIPTAVATVNPEQRDILLQELRANERSVAGIYCAMCYESVANYRADVFRDDAGLLPKTYTNVDNFQLMAGEIRRSTMNLSVEKYGGSDIPKDQHLTECSTFLKGYVFEILRVDLAETDPPSFTLHPSATPDTRRAALEVYMDELMRTDRLNCGETFALADG